MKYGLTYILVLGISLSAFAGFMDKVKKGVNSAANFAGETLGADAPSAQAAEQAEQTKKELETQTQAEKEKYINGLFENDDLLKKITPNVVLCKSLQEAGVTIEFTGKEWRSVRDAIVQKDGLQLINAIIDTNDRSYIMYQVRNESELLYKGKGYYEYYQALPSLETIKDLIRYFRKDGFVTLVVRYNSEKNSIDFDRPSLMYPTSDQAGIRTREIIRDKDWTELQGELGCYRTIGINPVDYYTLVDEVVLVAFTNFNCSSDHPGMVRKPKHEQGSPYENWKWCLEDKLDGFQEPMIEKMKLISQKENMGEINEEVAQKEAEKVAAEYAKEVLAFLKQL